MPVRPRKHAGRSAAEPPTLMIKKSEVDMDGRDELKEALQRAAEADTSLAAVVAAQLKDIQARLLVLELLTQIRIAHEVRQNSGYRGEILEGLDDMVGQRTKAGDWISE